MSLMQPQGPPGSRHIWRRWSSAGLLLLALVLAVGSNALSAPSASAATETFWGWSAPTKSYEAEDSAAVELGTQFKVKTTGSATGIRFYKTPGNVGTHTGTLWSSTGQRLATVEFTRETSSGWQAAKFDTPVTLRSGRSYTVSYFAPQGSYVMTQRFDGQSLSSNLEASGGVFQYGRQSSYPTESWRDSQYWVDVTFEPGTASSPTPSSTPTTTATATAAPTATATPRPTATTTATPTPTATPTTGGFVVLGRSFPSSATTGVPAGTALTRYTGPCTITTANTVVDAKQVDCSLRVLAANVKITRSQINGTVYGGDSGSFSISDSDVIIGEQTGTGIGDVNFTATRVEVTGGNRSINCFRNCTVEGSYVHGQYRDASGRDHESGIRMGSNGVIRGNTIVCDAPWVMAGAGCSAALTGYGDFATVEKNTVDGNYFRADSGGYCVYGGSSPDKPYSSGVNNIKFTNNVWERGESRRCGAYGPIVAFDGNAPGNVWTNNVYDDGTTITP